MHCKINAKDYTETLWFYLSELELCSDSLLHAHMEAAFGRMCELERSKKKAFILSQSQIPSLAHVIAMPFSVVDLNGVR